jgi:hypothetical protein
MIRAKLGRHGFAMMWASPTQLSDGRKATTSWRQGRPDPSFARTSSGRSPDDEWYITPYVEESTKKTFLELVLYDDNALVTKFYNLLASIEQTGFIK